MTGLLARMQTAVELAITSVVAGETARPLVTGPITADDLAIHFILLSTAEHLSFDLAAVTAALNGDLTCTTQAFMTRQRTCVFATGEKITTDLATAPSMIVVGVLTALGR